jgi:Methyl-accepting chemotaxis protein
MNNPNPAIENKTQFYTGKIRYNIRKIKRMTELNSKKIMKVFTNLSIRKKLNCTFVYIGIIAIIFIVVGITGMLSLENKINRFSKDAFAIETKALNAEVDLMSIQNYVYKAMQSKQPEVSLNLAKKSEAEYESMTSLLSEIYNSDASIKSITPEIKIQLQNELKKAERYHKNFKVCLDKSDVNGAFGIYKNDYAPILNSISTVLDSIYTSAGDYARQYVINSADQTRNSIIIFGVLVVIGAASCFFLASITSNSIVQPVQEIEGALVELSKGNLDIPLHYRSKDELGSLSDATQKTIIFLKEYILNITDVLQCLANKEVNVKVSTEYIGSFSPIKDSLMQIIRFYQEMTEVLNTTSTEVTCGAEQLAELSEVITKDANTQTVAIQTLVEEVNHISMEIQNNTENVTKAYALSCDSMQLAESGNLHMEKLSDAVEEMNQQASEISKINSLINSIAEQTHLLSLNASIEAARAGNQGNGFAVIADEIRKLSNQTREAAATVHALIQTSIHSMKQGKIIAGETSGKLGSVAEYAAKTNELILLINETGQKQTEELNQALDSLKEISLIANDNLTVAEESHASSVQFLKQAEILHNKFGEFTA